MKTLLVLLGATGVGKTAFSLPIAESLGTPIISSDSRQIFREIPIGTAAPTPEEQKRVRHYFVGTKSVIEDYNAGEYEAEAMALIKELFHSHDTLLLTGGSMLYIDAICNGLDDIPRVSNKTREDVSIMLKDKGLLFLQEELRRLDPTYYEEADLQNPQRVAHAIEVCIESGKPYSSYRKGFAYTQKARPFRIVKVGLEREREELYRRINRRVDVMLEQGLQEEAEKVYAWRNKNSLNTVGYKEMFRYFDGEISLEEATRLIKQNSRHYAKRQMTWFRRDKEIHWFNANDTITEDIVSLLNR